MNFTIESDEGLPIRGNLAIPQNARALAVLVHGFKGFKDWGFFPWLAQRLAENRTAVCRFNMSRSGMGEDPETFERLDLFQHDTYSTQLADLRTVVRYAQQRLPHLRTFLLGHSRGGGVAILGAAGVPRLGGVIAWSPIARADRWDEVTRQQWRAEGHLDVVNARTGQVMRMSPKILDDYDARSDELNIEAAAGALQVPMLVVHGARDESVPVGEGRLLAAKAAGSSIVVIERASHTFNAIHPLVHVPFELEIAAEVSAHFIHAYA